MIRKKIVVVKNMNTFRNKKSHTQKPQLSDEDRSIANRYNIEEILGNSSSFDFKRLLLKGTIEKIGISDFKMAFNQLSKRDRVTIEQMYIM